MARSSLKEAKEMLRILNRQFIGSDGGPTEVGSFVIDSYKPGYDRLYQISQVTNKNGGVKVMSPWLDSKELYAFSRGVFMTFQIVNVGGWRYL